jgi:hypothetical protein
MTHDRQSAPKADALPGCATPRPAVSLGIATEKGKPGRAVRGNERRNAARTGVSTPGIVPNPYPQGGSPVTDNTLDASERIIARLRHLAA